MKDTDKEYCSEMLDLLYEHGVRDIVLSPGSRNAPILIAAYHRATFKKYVICDERDAAFFALGLAMVSRKPVAIACTSGTALYNYAPAIAESYYQKQPLIVISADRPVEWIDQNDSQTLIQPGALQNIVKKSYDIPLDSNNSNTQWYVNRIVNEAMLEATCANDQGPVHINIRFDSPLTRTRELEKEKIRVIRKINPFPYFHPEVLKSLTEKLRGKKIMVIAGFMPPDHALNQSISRFSELPQVVILAETISNLHIQGNPYAIDTVLSGLSEEEKRELFPDIVISIGGAPVSRMLKEFIRDNDNCEVWTLGDTRPSIDCYRKLALHIDILPETFFKSVFSRLRNDTIIKNFKRQWDEIKRLQLRKKKDFVEKIEWSELKAFKYILQNVPQNWNLFLSNGTVVRYGQLFTENMPHASYSNRGVSGIEGTTATAAGCAVAYKGNTLLITGDMSFSYSPGVMGMKELPSGFKIIVINNKGGGIFRFISPTRYTDCREEYFCADPCVPVEGLAKAYGWRYEKADSTQTLIKKFSELCVSEENMILEIKTDEEYSASILRKYMRLNGLKDQD